MNDRTQNGGEELPGYAGLLEAAPDAIVVINEEGIIVLVNAQTERLFGFRREELLGKSVESLIPQQLRALHERHRAHYVDEPRVRAMGSDLDLHARRKDASEFPVEISLSPLRTPSGLLISATIRDITRKRREERLFRGLLEAAPDAMVIVDRDGRILLVNAQAERLFGYHRSELVDQPVEMLVPERFSGMHQAFRHGYLREPRTRPMGLAGDLFALRKDGSEFPVEISLSPLQTDEGMVVSAAVRDIGERRRIQRESDRVKDEFFATVSHELRTPLTSMIGYGELMTDLEELSPQGRRFLSVITRSAERELRLVDDLLTLVMIEESGLSIQRRDIDLGAIVRDAVEVARPPAEEAELELSLETPGSVVQVSGDRDRLGQALDNLLSNAIKFTGRAGKVRVVLHVDETAARIDVIDTGTGITEAIPDRLFERLYRASDAVERQIPGAGLGLPIARAIIEAHGGTIRVAHTGPAGSTFRMELPV